ncbi:MAG: cell division protein FtsH, partial [candidate division WOR-3 bacterium]
YCLNQLTVMLGGRAAEQIVFNDISTGSRDDIDRATMLARRMVTEWGMSEKVGPLTFGKGNEEIFLGRELGLHRTFSEETARLIDSEIKRIVDTQAARASQLIRENRDKLDRLARALLEKEALSGSDVDQILGLRGDDKKQTVVPPI